MVDQNTKPEELTREDAIDFLMMMSAKAAVHPMNRNTPPEKLFEATCNALELIGVTDDEIGAWGVRNIRRALGVPDHVVTGDQYGNTVDKEIIVPVRRNSDSGGGE